MFGENRGEFFFFQENWEDYLCDWNSDMNWEFAYWGIRISMSAYRGELICYWFAITFISVKIFLNILFIPMNI